MYTRNMSIRFNSVVTRTKYLRLEKHVQTKQFQTMCFLASANINPFKPSVPFVGYWQTVHNQISFQGIRTSNVKKPYILIFQGVGSRNIVLCLFLTVSLADLWSVDAAFPGYIPLL